jgi:hypothetical protein
MNVPEFQARWRASTLTERASAQSHFLDICELIGHAKPAELDPSGVSFTFEKSLGKTGGGSGFADVWYKGHFAWEYKKPGENLDKAYRAISRPRFPCPPAVWHAQSGAWAVLVRSTRSPLNRGSAVVAVADGVVCQYSSLLDRYFARLKSSNRSLCCDTLRIAVV